MCWPTSDADAGEVHPAPEAKGTTMNTMHTDPQIVRAEIESRYPQRHPSARRDSSLEILRRTFRRNERADRHPDRADR